MFERSIINLLRYDDYDDDLSELSTENINNDNSY